MSTIDFRSEAESLFEYTRDLRRDFHRHPELGFQEHRSAGIIAKTLRELGYDVTEGVAKTGVVGFMRGGAGDGPTVLIRADMDALPIQEETGAEYASENPGVMHACGHDGHMAMGLTVARMLAAHREEWRGAVKLVFQPAEEGLGGAESMVKEGVLAGVDYALAMHLWNEKPLGWLGITDGPTMASADIFSIDLTGRGGHGAAPHLATDPVLAASHVVTALQSVVSRNVDPLEAAVVSVTVFKAGTAFNIIPKQAHLEGTIRTFDPEVTAEVRTRARRIALEVAQAFGCVSDVKIENISPAVINDPKVAAVVRSAAAELFPEATVASNHRTMGAEDMALMMRDIPGCYFFIGSANPQKGLDAPHHHPKFDFDERALPIGAALMAASAVRLLNEGVGE